MTTGFAITGKGFHIVFPNGWTVSVQFGVGNYCGHHLKLPAPEPHREEKWKSEDAEVAVWDAKGKWLRLGRDPVAGWVGPAAVVALLDFVAHLPADAEVMLKTLDLEDNALAKILAERRLKR